MLLNMHSFLTQLFLPAWFIAAFLPLPAAPEMMSSQVPETMIRMLDYQERRHDNARWWRNLNRVMIPVGFVVVVLVVRCPSSSFFFFLKKKKKKVLKVLTFEFCI